MDQQDGLLFLEEYTKQPEKVEENYYNKPFDDFDFHNIFFAIIKTRNVNTLIDAQPNAVYFFTN